MGSGEYGTVSLRVDDVEITNFTSYSVNSHFLTATDGFHFTIGDEQFTDAMLDLLVPGRKCQLLIDGALQCTGYIDVVDSTGDRHTGNVITINGCDCMSPVVRSEIDPRHRYPDKIPLDKLLTDILMPFGLTRLLLDNTENISVAANRALPTPKGGTKRKSRRHSRSVQHKPLKQYQLPKSRPHHGETFWQFMCRLVQREGLWIWPTVQGDGVVVGKPNYDQDPAAELRFMRGGATNNVLRGGIRRDGTDQPSFIIATGRVPPRDVQHTGIRCVIDNPLTGIETIVGGAPKRLAQGNQASSFASASKGVLFSDALIQAHIESYKFTTKVAQAPLQVENQFASLVARPKYVKDDESHTLDQLQNFVRRQMSLHVRHALVGRYEIEGHRFDNGVIPQVDMVISVKDDRARWNSPMWILARTFEKSRNGGTKTMIETLPLQALFF